MKIHPYFVKLSDCLILGLTASRDFGEVRLGINLLFCEVGLALTWEYKFPGERR